jgi:hypothetical protein
MTFSIPAAAGAGTAIGRSDTVQPINQQTPRSGFQTANTLTNCGWTANIMDYSRPTQGINRKGYLPFAAF